MFQSAKRTALTLGLLVSMPITAQAIDGAIPINQASALRGSVTATDAADFPVTLDAPGHYVMTSSLDVPSIDISAIEIAASHVTLDMNGFQITCSTCAGGSIGTGIGIAAPFGVTDATVRNGVITNMGSHGIQLSGQRTRVEAVRAFSNRGHGIHVGQNGQVERCIAYFNRADGIRASAHSTISDSLAAGNLDGGIVTTMGAVIRRNVATDNESDGIQADQGSTLSANVASFNQRFGINAYQSSISNNTTSQNVSAGITAEDGSVVGNVSTSNASALTAPTNTTGYGGNVFSGNGVGVQVSGGTQIDVNVCDADTNCP